MSHNIQSATYAFTPFKSVLGSKAPLFKPAP